MPEQEATTSNEQEAAVAVAERPAAEAPRVEEAAEEGKKKPKEKAEEKEYELEFETPFGKLEFEFEPVSAKEKKERRKREKAEQEAAKAAAKAAKKAEKERKKEKAAPGRGRTGLLIILAVVALIAVGVAVAIWLFARPGPEEAEMVPPEYRGPEMEPAAAQPPQGFVANARRRIREAVRAGRRASREAQQEQERRFRDMTRAE